MMEPARLAPVDLGASHALCGPRSALECGGKRERDPAFARRRHFPGDYAKRNETPCSPKKGEFMDVKKDGKPFKGVAKEPDKRRK